jgi:hypothetical protein
MASMKTDRLFIAAVLSLSMVPLVFAAQTTVSVISSLKEVRVFPNPWRADAHADKLVTFDRLPSNSTVKLFTVSGQWIKTLQASADKVLWDRTNDSGDLVASGLYLYVVKDAQGHETTGKVAIVR